MMKNVIPVIGLGLAVSGAAQAAEYTVDPAHTYPSFTINHLGFSTMTGKFDSSTGSLFFDPKARRGSVTITVDASSIDTGHDKRDDHLRSPDFFNVAEFPEITFVSNGVTFDGDVLSEVSGDLTILGVTKPVTLNVEAMNCGEHPFNKEHVCGFDASVSIKRSDFGMNYGLPAIGDEVHMTIELEAARNEKSSS